MFSAFLNNEKASRQPLEGVYLNSPSPECSFAYMTGDCYRVMVHTMATGCRDGLFHNEDAVTLYGYRVKDTNGDKGVIITTVVESSPASRRSSVTFDEDYAYAIHRDSYLRDVHVNPNYGVLGSCHMHPPKAHRFSGTDLNNFAMYLKDQKLYLAGLFHLEEGELRLKMRVCTTDRKHPHRILLWDLPTAVSDSEVSRLTPPEGKKSFEQIWKDVTGSSTAPRFVFLGEKPSRDHTSAPDHPSDRMGGPISQPAQMSQQTLPSAVRLDLSALQEGAEGLLCGRMSHGVLCLMLRKPEDTSASVPDQAMDEVPKEEPASGPLPAEPQSDLPAELSDSPASVDIPEAGSHAG